MSTLIKKVRIIDPKHNIDLIDDVFIDTDIIEIAPKSIRNNSIIINGRHKIFAPGLLDLHVHFREPGATHKEDIHSGITAALAGGVTSALVMPNTNPAIDNFKSIDYQKKRAKKSGFDLMVSAAATMGLRGQEISDIENIKLAGAKAITDDGRPIEDAHMMEEIFRRCRRHDLVFMQHAEDLSISHGRSLHEGQLSSKLGLAGQPGQAETSMVKRDIALAEKLAARYHVLHLSCKETLDLVAKAKARGVKVSCEVTPHHIMLADRELHSLDTCKKMNPPLRSKDDVWALINGLNNRSIDAVASDHAPHSRAEKNQAFTLAPFGVAGVQTSILVLLTLVKTGKLNLNRAIELMSYGPARVLGEEDRIGTIIGEKALKNAVLLDMNFSTHISYKNIYGRSKNSAFLGMELSGRVLATFLHGRKK